MHALAHSIRASLWRSVRLVPSLPPLVEDLHLEEVRAVVAKVELLVAPTANNVVPIHRPVAEEEERPSAWEPEPVSAIVTTARSGSTRRHVRDEALIQQEINGSKTLLLEIIRRSVYDYILYRGSRRLNFKLLADQAYQWLFVECEGSKDWLQRARDGKDITSFAAICDALDLDIEAVRRHAKQLTPKSICSIGRPAEYRRRDVFSGGDDTSHALPMGMPAEEEVSDGETIY